MTKAASAQTWRPVGPYCDITIAREWSFETLTLRVLLPIAVRAVRALLLI
jgi:hypothetical protein